MRLYMAFSLFCQNIFHFVSPWALLHELYLTLANTSTGIWKAFANLIDERYCLLVLFAFPWLAECWTFFHIYYWFLFFSSELMRMGHFEHNWSRILKRNECKMFSSDARLWVGMRSWSIKAEICRSLLHSQHHILFWILLFLICENNVFLF